MVEIGGSKTWVRLVCLKKQSLSQITFLHQIIPPNHCQSLLKIVYSNLIWNRRDCIEIPFPGFHCNRQVAFHQKSFLRILGVGQYKKGLFCNDFEVHSTATPTLVYSYMDFDVIGYCGWCLLMQQELHGRIQINCHLVSLLNCVALQIWIWLTILLLTANVHDMFFCKKSTRL